MRFGALINCILLGALQTVAPVPDNDWTLTNACIYIFLCMPPVKPPAGQNDPQSGFSVLLVSWHLHLELELKLELWCSNNSW